MQIETTAQGARRNTTAQNLHNISRLLIRERNAEALLQGAADILTAGEGFQMVCIVRCQAPGEPTLSGDPTRKALFQRMSTTQRPQCLQRALRDGVAPGRCVQCDTSQQSTHAERAIILALEHEQQSFGVMLLEESLLHPKSTEELALLREIAEELAFALRGLERDELLREQEELLRETSKLAKIGGWWYDPVTERGAWTEEAAQIFDVKSDTRLSLADAIASFQGESRDKISEAIAEAQQGKPYDLELELVSLMGVRKWIRSIGKPEYQEGRLTRLRGTFQDITARKQAEAELLSERTLLRTLFDTIPDLVSLKSPEGAYLNCNRNFEMLYGIKEADLIGKTDLDFVEPAQAHFFRQHDQRAIELRGASVNEEWVTFLSDGHRELLETIKTPVYDQAGGLLGVLGIGRNITERKRISEELKRSQDRYRSLVDNLDDIIFSLDTNQNLTFINHAVTRLGYTPEALIGRQLDELLHPKDLELIKQRRRERAAGKSPGPFELRVKGASGRVHFFRATTRPTIEDGVVVGLTGVMVDVTQQRHIEEQLRAAQKIEAVGRLAGGVAHDFNNLLSVILSYAEMSLLNLRREDPLRADVEEIASAAIKGGRLTQQLLAFSRRQVLQPEVLSVNELTTNLAKMLGRLIGEDITLKVSTTQAPEKTKADRGQLEQVLMNLAVNARDAMPRGGTLQLSIETQQITPERALPLDVAPGGYVVLSVSDTGCGMDEATRARIFEPFFTTKSVGKGTGLGLSTVYGIIKQSNGGFEVESEPDKGTTFRLYLPQHHEESPAEKPPSARPIVRGQETILVVEDEPALRSVIRRALSAAGYNVLSAANAEEALLLGEMKGSQIRLVLTDLVMPGMNGRDLAGKMSVICPTAKILFTSGYADPIEDLDALGAHFLRKPFDWQTLVHKVRESLDAPQSRATIP